MAASAEPNGDARSALAASVRSATVLLGLLAGIGGLIGASHYILTQRQDAGGALREQKLAGIDIDMRALTDRVTSLERAHATFLEALGEIETQFDSAARLSFERHNALREALNKPPLPWPGSGARRDR